MVSKTLNISRVDFGDSVIQKPLEENYIIINSKVHIPISTKVIYFFIIYYVLFNLNFQKNITLLLM